MVVGTHTLRYAINTNTPCAPSRKRFSFGILWVRRKEPLSKAKPTRGAWGSAPRL